MEAFKFALYVTVPLFSSVFYANPTFMHDLILRLNFVKYPQAAPKPPVGAEIEALRARNKSGKKLDS
jgi:Pet100